MKTIDRAELERWTHEQRAFALVDVLPDDPACASRVQAMPHVHSQADFMAELTRLASCKDQPVVLYESASASVCCGAAAAMLEEAGFGSVYRFIGPQTALHASGHGASSEAGSE